MADAAPPARRVTPNLFGIAFGTCGLAEAWEAACTHFGVARAPADVLWVLGAVVWLVVLVGWVRDVAARHAWRAEFRDPVLAPFTALAAVVPMLAGAELAGHARAAGTVVWAVGLVVTVLLGGALLGQWVVSELTLAQWHPGYFLPTVAGGLLAAGTSAALGHPDLARVLFGYAVISWLTLGSVILARLFTQPRLPTPLLPTMAIQVAPPVVAGSAWFAIDGGRVDAVAYGLAGYAALMVLLQLRLVPLYRTVPFGPGWWAFSFSYAAVAVDGIAWLGATHARGGLAWTWVVLVVTTLAIGTLYVRTAIALARGRFLPAR